MYTVPEVLPPWVAEKLPCETNTAEPLGAVPTLTEPLLLLGELLLPLHAAKASAKHNTTRLYTYARARLID